MQRINCIFRKVSSDNLLQQTLAQIYSYVILCIKWWMKNKDIVQTVSRVSLRTKRRQCPYASNLHVFVLTAFTFENSIWTASSVIFIFQPQKDVNQYERQNQRKLTSTTSHPNAMTVTIVCRRFKPSFCKQHPIWINSLFQIPLTPTFDKYFFDNIALMKYGLSTKINLRGKDIPSCW